jgi:cell division protein FtsI/penicillin-binding protein 2
MRRTARLIAVLAVPPLAAGLVACSHQPSPDSAVSSFLDGWRNGQFSTELHLVSADGGPVTGADAAGKIKSMAGDLGAIKPTLKAGATKVTKNDASAPIDVSWPLGTGVAWKYQTTLRLRFADGRWEPIWEPAVFAPNIADGEKLTVKTAAAPRGSILDNGGQPIVTNQQVVVVGIEPDLVKDMNTLVKALDDAFKSVQVNVDLSDLPGRVQSAKKNGFVEVVRLRQQVYDQIRSKIHELDGTVFRTATAALAPSTVFAHALLGTVGDVTKERMDAKPGKYQIGDQVGYGGLQEAYDDRLAGTPGITVAVAPKPKPDGTSEAERIAFSHDPVAGQPITTSLDVKTQNAADSALAGITQPAAIVAMRISDGAILAVANGPGPADLDLGLNAQVPPGSTFKSVTATNLLEAGKADVNTVVECSDTVNIGGHTFHNAEGEVPGKYPLHQDFAVSCNTAFARLAGQLGPTGLRDTAARLGIGLPWDLGLPAFTGKVSANGDDVEQAAAAFGQGTTLVSPIALTGCAAALARGQWKQPHLVLDPAPAKPAPDQDPLKQSTVDAMHQMMREVVTSGTAKSLANQAGPPISGKTGTAEFDNDVNHAHSWFMGFRGDLAFAVFIQNGGLSTKGAVPLAGKFFSALG